MLMLHLAAWKTTSSESTTTSTNYTITGLEKPTQMTSDFQYTVAKDEVTGVYKATLDVQLPPICVTRYKADKNDFKYEMQRAVTEVVEAIIEKQLDD